MNATEIKELKEVIKKGLQKPVILKDNKRTVAQITNEMYCNHIMQQYYPHNLN